MDANKVYKAIYRHYLKLKDEDGRIDYQAHKRGLERFIVESVIRENEGVKARAASSLSIGRQTLSMICKRYGLHMEPANLPYRKEPPANPKVWRKSI